jgi:nicotinamide phosphoribosyltransferase
MFLAVVFTALYQLFKFLFEHGLLLVLCFLCFSFSFEAEFLHCFDTTLDDMEAVNDYGCIRKGSIECLWDIFGGTINDKGFKVLNPKVGLIYGDSITPQRANDILAGLAAKGFASSNIVFGIGSYAYNYSTRDSLGFAIKATAAIDSDDNLIPIQKTVKTDTGKKSACGLLHVTEDLKLIDNATRAQESTGALKVIFSNGSTNFETNFAAIRERAGN